MTAVAIALDPKTFGFLCRSGGAGVPDETQEPRGHAAAKEEPMSTYNIHRELAKLEWWIRKEQDVNADMRDAVAESRNLGGEHTCAVECFVLLGEMVAKKRSSVAADIAYMFQNKEGEP